MWPYRKTWCDINIGLTTDHSGIGSFRRNVPLLTAHKLRLYMNFISPNTAAQYNIESKIKTQNICDRTEMYVILSISSGPRVNRVMYNAGLAYALLLPMVTNNEACDFCPFCSPTICELVIRLYTLAGPVLRGVACWLRALIVYKAAFTLRPVRVRVPGKVIRTTEARTRGLEEGYLIRRNANGAK